MSVPKSRDARIFHRCAALRMVEARILQKADQATGAVYLAGYGVECMMKALILERIRSKEKRAEMLVSFRGQVGHNFDWLKHQLFKQEKKRLPPKISEAFSLVNQWSTELRYDPTMIDPDEAAIFLDAAEKIMSWADGRI